MARPLSIFVTLFAILIGATFTPSGTPGIFHFVATYIHSSTEGITPSFALPQSQWKFDLTQLEQTDLRGQNALVTGANSGIGFEISRLLSRQGASVTLACRNPQESVPSYNHISSRNAASSQKCFQAVDKIRKAEDYSGAPIHPLLMDVSSLQSVQKAAKIYMQQHSDKLDMLFLNAGVYTAASEFDSNSPLTLSKDGIEMVFATNVLGHHLLYKLLQPLLFKSNMARVVLTSSFMSYTSFDYGVATDLQTLNTGDSSLKHSVKVYGQSKLAQIMLVKSMVKQLQQENISNVYVNAANPGIVRTPMQYRHSLKKTNPPLVNTITKWIQDKQNMWNATEGALTPIYLGVATNDIHHMNINGRYYSPMAVEAAPATIALDEELQEKVWKFCNDLVQDYVLQERSD